MSIQIIILLFIKILIKEIFKFFQFYIIKRWVSENYLRKVLFDEFTAFY